MRKLLVFVLVLALLYGGYWFIGASAMHTAAENWFTEQTAQGRIATRESLTGAGLSQPL